MSNAKHATSIPMTLTLGEEDEIEIAVEVEFTISRGRPARGPSYASGGEPAEPAEIEFISVWTRMPIKGSPGHFAHEAAPEWLAAFVTGSDSVYEACGEDANWGESCPDPDIEYERRRDDAMER